MADEDVVISNDEVLAIYYTSSCICLGCRWSNLIGVGGSVPDARRSDAALLYHAVIPLYYLPGLMERAVLSAPSEFSMQTCGAKFTFAPVLGARQMQMEACL